MNPTIRNPERHARAKFKRQGRRGKRTPSYPVLAAGEYTFVGRRECGRNKPIWNSFPASSPLNRVLVGQFVFSRSIFVNRSKFLPAVEDAKHAAAHV